jgi:hypothetical protein
MHSWYLLSVAFCVLVAGPASALDITTCGQEVPPSEIGVLTTDLDCSGLTSTSGVILRKGAMLDLQGHTIIGPNAFPFDHAAVHCDSDTTQCHENPSATICRATRVPCTVTSTSGTGVIQGIGGILAERALVASNLLIQPFSVGIIIAPYPLSHGSLEATDIRIENGSTVGIFAAGKLVRNRMIGAKMTLANVEVHGFGELGILAEGGSINGSSVVVTDNQEGGIFASRVRLNGLTATGNGSAGDGGQCGAGLCAAKIQLASANLHSNFQGDVPMDLLSWWRMPRLDESSTCGYSGVYNYDVEPSIYETWGVCSND